MPVAIVGVGAVLPDAPDAPTFWSNLQRGRYSITDTPARWDASLYYDADPKAPDKTYSKIGGWVREYTWDPMGWRMPIPPRVGDVMDPAQKWAVVACREALLDYGYPERPLDQERTAVILGNALGGDMHLFSAARILFPEIEEELKEAPSFQALPAEVRSAVLEELVAGVRRRTPDITEDTMPGELGNIVAGRVAALFDFKGPNYITDAACASAMAALTAAAEGLEENHYDAVLTGGIDANMSASTYVKFAKIGALSATGTRPYAEGADGFVMGEGAAVFLLRRLADAERDGDRVYAVVLGLGGSSDGRGKGITAPNPVGQKFAVRRAWERAGVGPEAGDMLEGHGTSTRVGDVVEVESLSEVFRSAGLPVGSVALGSVKSNIGHLKGAAGAAGVLKAALALHHGMIPPSVNFHAPNPNIDFGRSPFAVNTELEPWDKGVNGRSVRRAGVSAFGFGGTNFHLVMEEHVPGRHRPGRARVRGAEVAAPAATAGRGAGVAGPAAAAGAPIPRAPLRGALLVGGPDDASVLARLRAIQAEALAGRAPEPAAPAAADLSAPVRVAVDYGDAAELAELAGKAAQALESGDPGRWRALRNKGGYLGRGAPGKVAFLYTGQGSQYVGMLDELRREEPVVAETFAEADRVMTPILGSPLTDRIFVADGDGAARVAAEEGLTRTAITQPAVLTVDVALTRLLASYGVEPDLVMGHSLGEYGALVTAGAIPFGDALTAVGARGEAMTRLSLDDNGLMAAVFGPLEEVRRIVDSAEGYAVVANVNSTRECVIGGSTEGVGSAMEALRSEGLRVVELPVSHAFHTDIVAPAAKPLRDVLRGLGLRAPAIPVVANVDASFYPTGPDAAERMVEILGRQVGSPVQFVKGLETLYDAGARIFVEVGPKRALFGMAEDVVGDREGVTVLFTNHPRTGDVVAVNRALCGLYAAGVGRPRAEADAAGLRDATRSDDPSVIPVVTPATTAATAATPATPATAATAAAEWAPATPTSATSEPARGRTREPEDRYVTLGRMFADFLDRSFEIHRGGRDPGGPATRPVGITGAALGLPGGAKVYDDANVARILRGEQLIGPVPQSLRDAMLERRITRLVKGANGEARFDTIEDPAEVIKLAGRAGELELVEEFGFPEDRLPALDWVTRLAIAAGIDALRDAGIPLVRRYKVTTTGSRLPTGWGLPESMRDDTGIIFGSAFPGYDQFARAMAGFYEDRSRRERLAELRQLRTAGAAPAPALDERIAALEARVEDEAYRFDRRFLFQVLAMGHSQFAEYVGARGPNTATNAACATGTQAVALAQDWIQAGRCRRVIVITADDVTTEHMLPWFGSGFLASGAAATDERVEDAAIPFDRRRHGLIMGMGGAALVVEALDSAAERGLWPICEVLGSVVANSAYHGSRLDVEHIADVMERLVADVERRHGVDRTAMARETVFVSHETYTPARGGSAGAEVRALRQVFGPEADAIVVANTKGYTGHPMGVAVEDALAVKMLETGIVPPVANYREVDPELGRLNLSRGGSYPVRYALRLAAGFGSQISMSVLRWTPPPDAARRRPDDLGFRHRIADPDAWAAWLRRVSGYETPRLEVASRTLRIADEGPSAADVRPRAGAEAVAAPAAPPVEASPPVPEVPTPEPAAIPAPTPGPVAPAPDSGPVPSDPVAAKVLEIVSEQTGYPPDMLELDLDLEADLGIDTVKQAEMFAAIRAAWDIERDDSLALRDYPTLAHAVGFVYERRPDLGGPHRAPTGDSGDAPAAGTGGAPPISREIDARPAGAEKASSPGDASLGQAPAADDPVAAKVLEIVSEQTGYPPDMLELDLDLEADLGIDTVKQAEMFAAIRAAWDIERDDSLALRDYPTLAHAVGFVYERRPDLGGPHRAPTGDSGDAPAAGTGGAPPISREADARPAGAEKASSPGDASLGQAPAADDPVAAKVLEIVSEQTGYPPDMLELDLDLEADLGIDTVKQAEMFAAIRAAWDIERDDSLALRDYPTLAHAVGFVYERRPDLGGPHRAPTGDSEDGRGDVVGADVVHPDAGAGVGDGLVQPAPRDARGEATPKTHGAPPGGAIPVASMEAAQAVPRRIPVPRLRLPLDRYPATGVELAEGARVVVVPDEGGVGVALAARLEDAGCRVFVADPSEATGVLVRHALEWRGDAPVTGVFWLPAMDPVLPVELEEPDARREALRRRVKALHALARALYDDLEAPGSFLVAGVRLGGRHGYDADGATDAAGGAVTGFAKAVARERPAALVKAVDFEPSRKTVALAELLAAETLGDPGVVEVGYADERRWTVGLADDPVESGEPLGEDAVFLVTGAAGSIVSAVVADLAREGGVFWLLDLAPEPDPTDPDLARLSSDREGLKRDLFERLRDEGERVTPVQVERELARLERAASAAAAIAAVTEAGGTVHYRSVDLRDAEAVGRVAGEVVAAHGRVDALVHAAGLEISRSLPAKSEEEFALVFDVKVEGWYNLMTALAAVPVERVMAFSSIAGRFGNAGQADYSAANDLLCKAVSEMRRSRPATRALSLDWTAWRDIGMAARGSIPAIMEEAGIDMLDPAAGIAVVRRELTAGSRGEAVIAQGLGRMLHEDPEAATLDATFLEHALGSVGPMVDRLRAATLYDGLVVEKDLDPGRQPFLDHHRIDGTAVLPGVMGLEAMAEAARLGFPDHRVIALEDVSFDAPFKFYRDAPRTVTVHVQYDTDGEDVLAHCRLTGRRTLVGRGEPEVTVHFTGTVRLGTREPDPAPIRDLPRAAGDEVGRDAIYRTYFHGPAYQVVDGAWRGPDGLAARFARDLPGNHVPAERSTVAAPRLVELAFQAAGLLELAQASRLGLPAGFERLEMVRPPDGEPASAAVVEPGADGAFDVDVADAQGRLLLRLEGYRTTALPGTVESEAFQVLRP